MHSFVCLLQILYLCFNLISENAEVDKIFDLKEDGNKLYKQRNFIGAIHFFSEAINLFKTSCGSKPTGRLTERYKYFL